jgi:putative ABC transport system permease protein
MSSAHHASRALVFLAGLLVPESYRTRFLDEWRSELYYHREGGAPPLATLLRSLGAFEDAVSTRRMLREAGYDAASVRRNSMLTSDLRLALRSILSRPWQSLLIVLILAVGIGANAAIFSLIHAVLLQPLGYADPDRLLKVQGFWLDTGTPANLSPADFYDLAAENAVFESMGAHGWVGFFTVTGQGAPERVGGSNVTSGFFETLGVKPALGRLFTPEDERADSPLTALLTHAYWMARFGGDPDVVGKTIAINAEPHSIVGVLPPDYAHPEPNPDRDPLLYTLYRFDPADLSRSGRFIRAVGRLREGRSFEKARAELVTIMSRLEREHPETNLHASVHVVPLKEAIVGDVRRGLLVLYGAVGAVLLIACANLANLQLAQAAIRRHALAIQSALGAGRARLVRQLLLESFLLALAGGVLGFFLAASARELLALRAIPRAVEVDFDVTVFVFALLVSGGTAILFGLVPALSLSSGSLRGALVEGGTKGSSARTGARRVLVAVEVALSLVLLVSAGLFLRSLEKLNAVSPGFRPESILTLSTSLPQARYPEGDQIPFYDALYERVRSLPGVSAVGAINILPLTNNYSTDAFQIEDRPVPEGEKPGAEARSVGAGYFEAMGIPLLRGRLFDERDRKDSPGVVIVSESMAAKFWPGEDPLGKRITYNRGIPEVEEKEVGGPGSREIVGIVGDVKHLGLDQEVVPTFYTPQPHHPSYHTMTLVVRAAAAPDSVFAAVKGELAAMDPEVPLYSARPLRAVLEGSVAEERFRARLLGFFAALALGLATVGVYAVMGRIVDQREQEIGIRMALGANAKNVVGMLVLESLKPVLWGLVAGGIAAVLLTRLVRSLLFQIEPGDPLTYVSVAVILLTAAVASALVPTLRAARVDPVKTLRGN